jgi:PHP family Zn ribbon phosphoesterase
MTPNNIVNMALLNGLDIIALTDHNSAGNVEAAIEVGRKAGLIVVPGMELCVSEEYHMLCLFSDVDKAHAFQDKVYEQLPPFFNREDIFGPQIRMDALDQEIGREERMLSGACGMDTETAMGLVRDLGGVILPAHINRESFSMLNTLGAIPPEYGFHFLECSKNCKLDQFLKDHPELLPYTFFHSSDAHFLWDILEQEVCLELPEKSIPALLDCLNGSC